jgi:N-acetylmuramoyl-L-alanine amidase./Bacterial SH3 domain.
MKVLYGFTRLDTIKELTSYINKLNITRKINGLQVHHTYQPDYSCFYKSNGSHEDELTRQYNMKDFHVNINHWDTIAQHFTVFPNGRVVTGRNINSTPIGIKGWNTNKICIEIYGNFDRGHDTMTKEQEKAVIALYALLCKKLNITPSTTTIKPHCWFTASGSYLGYYSVSRSAKSCPGTNFMSTGCDSNGMKKFITKIKSYNGEVVEPETFVVRIKPVTLNIRSGPSVNGLKVGEVHKGESFTIVETRDGWGKLKSGVGWINISSKYVDRL